MLHELERGGVEVVNVGIALWRHEAVLSHTRHRAWRLYLCFKHVLRLRRITGEALRVVAGHLAHFFVLLRPAFSALYNVYQFIQNMTNGKSHLPPRSVKRTPSVLWFNLSSSD